MTHFYQLEKEAKRAGKIGPRKQGDISVPGTAARVGCWFFFFFFFVVVFSVYLAASLPDRPTGWQLFRGYTYPLETTLCLLHKVPPRKEKTTERALPLLYLPVSFQLCLMSLRLYGYFLSTFCIPWRPWRFNSENRNSKKKKKAGRRYWEKIWALNITKKRISTHNI